MSKIKEAVNSLSKVLDKFDWFCSSDVEKNHIVVYCNYITQEVDKEVPVKYEDFDVKLRFTDYLFSDQKGREEVLISVEEDKPENIDTLN